MELTIGQFKVKVSAAGFDVEFPVGDCLISVAYDSAEKDDFNGLTINVNGNHMVTIPLPTSEERMNGDA